MDRNQCSGWSGIRIQACCISLRVAGRLGGTISLHQAWTYDFVQRESEPDYIGGRNGESNKSGAEVSQPLEIQVEYSSIRRSPCRSSDRREWKWSPWTYSRITAHMPQSTVCRLYGQVDGYLLAYLPGLGRLTEQGPLTHVSEAPGAPQPRTKDSGAATRCFSDWGVEAALYVANRYATTSHGRSGTNSRYRSGTPERTVRAPR